MVSRKVILLAAFATLSRPHNPLDPLEYPDMMGLARESLGRISGLCDC
jgi:hypothetical protein